MEQQTLQLGALYFLKWRNQPGEENNYMNCKMRKSPFFAMPQVVPNPKKIGEPLCMAYALESDNWQLY